MAHGACNPDFSRSTTKNVDRRQRKCTSRGRFGLRFLTILGSWGDWKQKREDHDFAAICYTLTTLSMPIEGHKHVILHIAVQDGYTKTFGARFGLLEALLWRLWVQQVTKWTSKRATKRRPKNDQKLTRTVQLRFRPFWARGGDPPTIKGEPR